MTNNSHISSNSSSLYEAIRASLIIALVVTMVFMAGYIENHYNKTATVEYVNSYDYVTAIDDQGNYWGFYADNLHEGDIVKLEMATNCTDSIYDDKVIKVKKCK